MAQVLCHRQALALTNIAVITALITVYITPSPVLIIQHTWEAVPGRGDVESQGDRQFGPSSEASSPNDQGSREGCCWRRDEKLSAFIAPLSRGWGLGPLKTAPEHMKIMNDGQGGGSPVWPGPGWRSDAVVTGKGRESLPFSK